MKKDDELRRKLAETFEDFAAEPQPQTWENIREAIRPKRKRRPLWLFFWLGWACLLVGAGIFSVRMRPGAIARGITPVSATETSTSKPADWSDHAALTEQEAAQSPSQPTAVSVPTGADTMASQVSAPRFFATTKPRKSSRHLANPDKIPISSSPLLESGLKTPTRLSAAFGLPTSSTETEIAAPPPANPSFDSAQVVALDTVRNAVPINGPALLPLGPTRLLIAAEPLLPPISAQAAIASSPPPKRKGVFSAGLALLSTYQNMQSQALEGSGATNIRLLPALDKHRLGLSGAAGYRLPLHRRGDLGVALTWMNLPFRAEYAVKNTHQVQVEIQSATQYRISPTLKSTVSDVKRLNWWGGQLQYGYTCTLLHQKIRAFAGAEGLWSVATGKPEIWGQAGFDIPLSNRKFQLTPVFKYQFQPIEQADRLLQTRLYTLGIGLKRSF